MPRRIYLSHLKLEAKEGRKESDACREVKLRAGFCTPCCGGWRSGGGPSWDISLRSRGFSCASNAAAWACRGAACTGSSLR